MQNQPNGFSARDAMRMANSPQGKKLMEILRQSHGQSLQNVMEQAQAGNYDQVRQMLADVMQNPEARELLNQLGGSGNG